MKPLKAYKARKAHVTHSASMMVCCVLFALCSCASQVRDRGFIQGTLRARELVSLYGEHTSGSCARYLTSLVRRVVGSDGYDLSVRLLNTNEPLALVPGNNEILVSTGLIKILRSEAEAAFMLTHEVGHIALGHQELLLGSNESDLSEQRPALELDADRFALTKLAEAGYSTSAALSALERVSSLHPSTLRNPNYPAVSERLRQLSAGILSTAHYGRGIEDRRDFQRCRRTLP